MKKKVLVIIIAVLVVLCLVVGIALTKNSTKHDENKGTTSVEETEKNTGESETDKNTPDETTDKGPNTEILEDDSKDKGVVIDAPSSWDNEESSETKQEITNPGVAEQNPEGTGETPEDDVEYGTIF